MLDYIAVGPVPCYEDCAQVGEADFMLKSKREMNAFINQLYREFPEAEENNVLFKIKWFNHDFGRYGEVVAYYMDDDKKSSTYALHVEWLTPTNWDDEARKELGL